MTEKKELQEIFDLIDQMLQDPTIPRNLKEMGDKIIKILKENTEESIDLRARKCLDLLEEVDEDPNIPLYIRSQLWSLVSLLENL